MCGIIGYVGHRDALDVLLQGLRTLTYRGYDSAGVAVLHDGDLAVTKCEGKVADLEIRLNGVDMPGVTGIGHTRWATHGEPSDTNAHPHIDNDGNIAVVHNGIFENSESLRKKLRDEGAIIRSRTDTELFAHLVSKYYVKTENFELAVRGALGEVEGAFSIVVVSKRDPDKLIVAKRDVPPLIIGLGEGEMFVSSDISGLIHFTKKVVILEDGEMAVLTPDHADIQEFRERPVVGRRLPASQRVFTVDMPPDVINKGGYPHFMLKEIHEQPTAIRDTLRERLMDDGKVQLENFRLSPATIRNARRIIIVGCGTAFHAGLVCQYYYEPVLRIPVQVEVASEYRYRDPIVGPEDLVIAISQSGETADTLSVVKQMQAHGAQVIAVTNVVGSALAQIANHVLLTRAGPEIAVASTKAFTAQLVACQLLLIYIARYRTHSSDELLHEMADALATLPATVGELLADVSPIQALAERLARYEDAYFIGRNLDEPIAREGSLKLKEIAYIHCEAFAAGELKHGTLALLEPGTPVIAIATQSHVYEKTVSNIQEVLARRAWVIGIVPETDQEIASIAGDVLRIPSTHEMIAPILTAVVLQLLAYYCAFARGCDIDQPRNLAKSVTVE